MENEIWRPVVGFEGHYEVSNTEKIRSIIFKGKPRLRVLKPFFRCKERPYYAYNLVKNGRKEIKTIFLHVAVARAFPEICGEWFEGCVVDHIDTNIYNNKPENLRVTTQNGNLTNPISNQRRMDAVIRKCSKKVIAKNGVETIEFGSVREAERHFGVQHGAITNCLNGRAKTSCGYQWEYA